MKKFTDIFIPFHFDDLVGGREFEQAMKLCFSTMAITLLIFKILDYIENSLSLVTEVTIPYFLSSSISAILGCFIGYYFLIGMLWILVEAVRKALEEIKSMNQAKEISASETFPETNADCLQISPDVPIDAELESKPEVLHTKEKMGHSEKRDIFKDFFNPKISEESFVCFLEDNESSLNNGEGLATLYLLMSSMRLTTCNLKTFHSYVSRKITCVGYNHFSQKKNDVAYLLEKEDPVTIDQCDILKKKLVDHWNKSGISLEKPN